MSNLTLSEQRRKQLDGIVDQATRDGLPESEIQFIVNDFKGKYGTRQSPTVRPKGFIGPIQDEARPVGPNLFNKPPAKQPPAKTAPPNYRKNFDDAIQNAIKAEHIRRQNEAEEKAKAEARRKAEMAQLAQDYFGENIRDNKPVSIRGALNAQEQAKADEISRAKAREYGIDTKDPNWRDRVFEADTIREIPDDRLREYYWSALRNEQGKFPQFGNVPDTASKFREEISRRMGDKAGGPELLQQALLAIPNITADALQSWMRLGANTAGSGGSLSYDPENSLSVQDAINILTSGATPGVDDIATKALGKSWSVAKSAFAKGDGKAFAEAVEKLTLTPEQKQAFYKAAEGRLDSEAVTFRQKTSPAPAGPAPQTKQPNVSANPTSKAVDAAKAGGKIVNQAGDLVDKKAAEGLQNTPTVKDSLTAELPTVKKDLTVGPVASNKENVAAQRAKRSLPDLPEPERRSIQTMIDDAAKSGTDGMELARTLINGKKSAGEQGTAVLTLEAGKISQKIDALLAKAAKTTDNAELETISEKMDLLLDDLNTVHQAVQKAGTEWGREGIARQIELRGDMSAPAIQLKMRKHKELTEADFRYSKTVESKFNDYEAKIKGLEDELTAERARQTTAREARRAPRFSKKDLDDELNQLLKDFSAQRAKVTSGVDPEMLVTVGKIAVNYMKRGVNTLDEVYAAVKTHIQGLSYDDFVKGIDEATKREPRTQSELQKAISDLKRQAKSDAYAQRKIAEYRDMLRTGSYVVPTKKERIISKRLEDLNAEKTLLKKEVDARIRSMEKTGVGGTVNSILNLPRTLKTAFDVSAAGRQGWILGVTNPRAAIRAFRAQGSALLSEKSAAKVQNAILNSQNARIYGKMKVYFSPLDGHGEEFFQSSALDWWKKFNPIRGSERGYNAYMNTVRAGAADSYYNTLKKWTKSNFTDEDLQVLGNFINVASGRGGSSLPALTRALQNLNGLLFAGRFAKSRVEFLVGQPLFTTSVPWSKSLKARAIIAREYSKFLGVMGTTLGLIKLYADQHPDADITVGTDAGSTEFGKIKVGNTRVDLGAGLLQYATFMYRMGTGRYVKANGTIIDLSNPKYGQPSYADVATRFFRSKTSPIVSTAWNVREGKDYIGNPIDSKSTLIDLVAPLSVKELADGLVEDGWSRDDALTLLNFLGFSTQTYDSTKKEKKERPN